jgi:cysteine desulfurase/selenocysteine lyase
LAVAGGLGAAVDYVCGLGMVANRQHEIALAGEAIAKLEAIEGVRVHGPKDPMRRGAAISFSVEGIHPHDVGTLVDREGVAVRAGHHCAKPLIRALGQTATTRASFYLYNTSDDVDRLVDALVKTKRFFLG